MKNDLQIQETITFSHVNKIYLKNIYAVPTDTIKELKNEFSGKPKVSYLMVEMKKQRRKFDFIIDSFQTLQLIEALYKTWHNKGYLVERV